MDTNEAWKKIDELKTKPELTDTPGYGMEELLYHDPGCQQRKLKMKQRITVAAYPESKIPERYWSCRTNERMCCTCSHFTARCDLRKNKRYIVPLEHGVCVLQKETGTCNSYRRIEELRASHMNPLEQFYHHMYTKKYLQKVLRWFFHDRELILNSTHRSAEEWADMIVTYKKHLKEKNKNNVFL